MLGLLILQNTHSTDKEQLRNRFPQLPKSEKESDKAKDLGEELADVVFVVLCLANQTGIDLQQAFDKKMDAKTKRDHDRHQNNPKLKQ